MVASSQPPRGSRAAYWAGAAAAAGGLSVLAAITLAAAVVGAVLAGGDAPAEPALNTAAVPAQYAPWVEAAGQECAAVFPAQIAAQIFQESGFDPAAKSAEGAEGIAQFLPGTWTTWGRADAPGPVTPYNAPDAIMAMGRYDCSIAAGVASVPGDALSNMLAGYNAGPASVLQYAGVPPFPQTQQYVASIEALIPRYELAAAGPSAAEFAAAEISAAERYLGTPYVWGGGNVAGPTAQGGPVAGFDCSGLVLYAVYQASGGTITLAHSSQVQATEGTPVGTADLQPGDAIAIQDEPQTAPGQYTHIVIYVGGGQVIQAPTFGQDVDIIPLADFNGFVKTIRWYGP